jgi:hypothetical protein
MTFQDPESPSDPTPDLWTRLRAYCEHGHALRYPTLTEEIECYPPATDEQLRATAERLGFPLPVDLRRLYAEVANGGLNLGPVQVFHGAIGGCGVNPRYWGYGPTIEELASMSGWRLHPRIEEALLRHPGRYVIADSTPEGFIWLGEDSELSLKIDGMTGRLYYTEFWGAFSDEPPGRARVTGPSNLLSIEAIAPSLSAWFARWLDDRREQLDEGPLLPEMVETADVPEPDAIWRGLYRIGPDWRMYPEETDLAHDAAHALYWSYITDAESGDVASDIDLDLDLDAGDPGSPAGDLPNDEFDVGLVKEP